MSASLSIIVPVLNEAPGIAATLDRLNRLRAQASAAFPGGIELIAVDGGSTDGTADLCRDRVDRLVLANRGRGTQLNAGAACATGEVLWFVHADTRLSSETIERLTRALSAHPKARWGRFDVRIEGRARMLRVVGALMNWRSALTGIATGDQAMFVRRDSFQHVGGFPEQPLMEDIELSKRLLQLPHGRPLRLRDRIGTSGRRWETRGTWRTIWLMWRLRWRYWRGTPADELAQAYR